MREPLNEQTFSQIGTAVGILDQDSHRSPIRQLMSKPPETTHFVRRYRRPVTWCFAKRLQATRVNSLTIAAGGLRAKERLSFKMGVFGAIEPPKAARRALWDKNKNSKP